MLGAQALRTKQRLEHQDKVRRLKLAAKKAREMKALEESASIAITAIMAPVVIHQSPLIRSINGKKIPNSGLERDRSKSRSFTASIAAPHPSTTSSSLNELSMSDDKMTNAASLFTASPLGEGRPCSECMRRQSSSYTNFSRSSRKASVVEEMRQVKLENAGRNFSHTWHNKKSSKCTNNAAGHSTEIVNDLMLNLRLKDEHTKSSSKCLTAGQNYVLQNHKSVNFHSTCLNNPHQQPRPLSTMTNPQPQKPTVTFDIQENYAQCEHLNKDCPECDSSKSDDEQRQSKKSSRKWYQPSFYLRNSSDKKQK
uniref:Uncharacterized protein n=1 Tax=Romanomermis culicivorax TaxID=13658 RepID=A0A915HK49_ROMCU